MLLYSTFFRLGFCSGKMPHINLQRRELCIGPDNMMRFHNSLRTTAPRNVRTFWRRYVACFSVSKVLTLSVLLQSYVILDLVGSHFNKINKLPKTFSKHHTGFSMKVYTEPPWETPMGKMIKPA